VRQTKCAKAPQLIYQRLSAFISGFSSAEIRITRTLIALEIDDITRFVHADKLCAYAGLVPTTHASGGKIAHGRIDVNLQQGVQRKILIEERADQPPAAQRVSSTLCPHC
jgi:hypothetical protein